MRRLNIQDSAFLTVETDESPTHVAGLQILELPPRYKGNFFQDMFDRFDLSAPPQPPFNLKLGGDLSRLELTPRWVEDQEFDLDYHIRFVRLPEPGTMEQLTTFVSRLHGQRLDRNHPLWECYCIEGIEGNRVAMYIKVHHALVDGVAATAIMSSTLSRSSRNKMDKGFWQMAPQRAKVPAKQPIKRDMLSLATESLGQVAEGVGTTTRTVSELGGRLLRGGFHMLSGDSREAPLPFQSPNTVFNTTITRHRRFGVATLPLSRVKDAGKNLDATINDLVLAICSGALRKYLKLHNSLPTKPLTTMCPVSVRPKDAVQEGNSISMIITTLATDVEDPLERLEVIKRSSRAAKDKVNHLSREAATNYSLLLNAAVLATNAVGLGGTVPPPANLVISNVPGPREQLFINGAKLVANYPMSVLVHSQALNITVTSYMDSIDFGLMADRETIPDVDVMAEMITEAALDLEEAFERKMETQAFQASEALAGHKRLKEAQAEAQAKAAAKRKRKAKASTKKAPTKKAAAKKKAAPKAKAKRASKPNAKAKSSPKADNTNKAETVAVTATVDTPVPTPPGETFSSAAE
ncbi:Wax ester synthase/acyl-CoA:diacylglycerol acyltransferase [Candidatus Phaeomarinobacter ectocarpi]|uniref:diacylglycerol O-acyltransferase n=1 Tax=Candidatus Phaeomarinibacter ectocarpi TaxID=1458461 RepID=X5M616_9HYPH|nr:wax ester/triacylglycerol synthase family O-acyltransferase [Candidatus Phaeomarinobacter ectocarpi]CDO58353.1 Wax ester synthase/acyl-CoA:diacylglycerol acyltransferase [Candidatus Phaeomarinobacter ectocarpi]